MLNIGFLGFLVPCLMPLPYRQQTVQPYLFPIRRGAQPVLGWLGHFYSVPPIFDWPCAVTSTYPAAMAVLATWETGRHSGHYPHFSCCCSFCLLLRHCLHALPHCMPTLHTASTFHTEKAYHRFRTFFLPACSYAYSCSSPYTPPPLFPSVSHLSLRLP